MTKKIILIDDICYKLDSYFKIVSMSGCVSMSG